ncbi:unnamed protein product [Ectocarpus sp. 12 AP-2014]
MAIPISNIKKLMMAGGYRLKFETLPVLSVVCSLLQQCPHEL